MYCTVITPHINNISNDYFYLNSLSPKSILNVSAFNVYDQQDISGGDIDLIWSPPIQQKLSKLVISHMSTNDLTINTYTWRSVHKVPIMLYSIL